jgi:putative transposase
MVERVDPNALDCGTGLGSALKSRRSTSEEGGLGTHLEVKPLHLGVGKVERVDLNALVRHGLSMADSEQTKYPCRLHHEVPPWVEEGALYHIRIRASGEQATPLIDPNLAPSLLGAVRRYHEAGHWWCSLVLLMPDHLHALLYFVPDRPMAQAVRDWKRGTARFQKVKWQENFFDHRIRSEKQGDEKWWYIRRNPITKGLCQTEDDWNWWWSPHKAE